jgi:hypothetical protein
MVPGPAGLGGGFEKLFENGFPQLPEKFLKGHMAKLAQEIVKDIKPEDLGITPEMVEECEKNPSRAFDILLQVFGNNPEFSKKQFNVSASVFNKNSHLGQLIQVKLPAKPRN